MLRDEAARRAAYRLGLDNDTIVAMPRIRLLPENNARQGFAEAKQVATICRRLPPDLADAVQFMFVTGWRSRSEVLPLTWAQVDFSGGFVRLEPGTTKNNEGRPSRSSPSSAPSSSAGKRSRAAASALRPASSPTRSTAMASRSSRSGVQARGAARAPAP